MMMDNDPMDNELTALLSDYAAPIPDDGFAAKVKAEVAKRARLRRIFIAGSGGLGAIIAAMQLPALYGIISGLPAASKLPADLTPSGESPFYSSMLEDLTWGNLSPVMMGTAIIGVIFIWFAAEATLEKL